MGKAREKEIIHTRRKPDVSLAGKHGSQLLQHEAHERASALRDAIICETLYDFREETTGLFRELLESQREPNVVFVRDSEDDRRSEVVTMTPQEIIEENESLQRENSQLKALLRSDMPHIRLFRVAIIVFAFCAFSILSLFWLNVELIHPLLSGLGMIASIGFMFMARAAGKSTHHDTDALR